MTYDGLLRDADRTHHSAGRESWDSRSAFAESIVCAVTISQDYILLATGSIIILFDDCVADRNLFAEPEREPGLTRAVLGSVPRYAIVFWCTFDFVFLFLSI